METGYPFVEMVFHAHKVKHDSVKYNQCENLKSHVDKLTLEIWFKFVFSFYKSEAGT